jgi:hypothetical protein
VVTTEHTETLADGNQIDRKSSETVCRDGQGRTWRQVTLTGIGSYSASGNAPKAIFINDPVAGVAYVLDPMHKTARKFTLPTPRNGSGKAPQQFQRGNSNANPGTSLGTQTIEGLLVQGTQYTRTIPAGREGNAQPIQIVSTRWTSSELGIDVKNEINDPQHGKTVTTLTNISRNEPDPSLFQVPADYTLQTDKPRPRGPRPGGPAPQ